MKTKYYTPNVPFEHRPTDGPMLSFSKQTKARQHTIKMLYQGLMPPIERNMARSLKDGGWLAPDGLHLTERGILAYERWASWGGRVRSGNSVSRELMQKAEAIQRAAQRALGRR